MHISKTYKNIFDGYIGIEKESLRITKEGRLSQSLHPFSDERITRDFCENQIEMITNPHTSVEDVYHELYNLHKEVVMTLEHLSSPEYLWLFSNPPYFENEDEIPIAQFTDEKKNEYRNYLAKKYGKKKMLFCGIHYNYSFAEDLLIETHKQYSYMSYKDFKNQFYLELSQKILKYSWFLVFLSAASPILDPSYLDYDTRTLYGSTRCSEIGYWNELIPIFDYNNISQYIQSIEKYVKDGSLYSTSELYYPVRLKPKGENSLDALKENGINHIELRMFDINPLSPIGFKKEDIAFIQAFIIFVMSFDLDHPMTSTEQIEAIQNMKEAAKLDSDSIQISWNHQLFNVKEKTYEFLNKMDEFYQENESIQTIIQFQREKIESRYCEILWKTYQTDFTKKGLQLTKYYVDLLKR